MRDRVRERYVNDPHFHAVVDMMRAMLMKYELTPIEIREAAMLACVMQEEQYPNRIVVALHPHQFEALADIDDANNWKDPYR